MFTVMCAISKISHFTLGYMNFFVEILQEWQEMQLFPAANMLLH